MAKKKSTVGTTNNTGNEQKEEVKYSFWIGIQKTLKNFMITVGIPAVAVLIDSYQDWLPNDWYPIVLPLISMISYLIKNKLQITKQNKK